MENTQAKQRKKEKQIKSTLPHRYQEELQMMEAGIGGRNNDLQEKPVVVDRLCEHKKNIHYCQDLEGEKD